MCIFVLILSTSSKAFTLKTIRQEQASSLFVNCGVLAFSLIGLIGFNENQHIVFGYGLESVKMSLFWVLIASEIYDLVFVVRMKEVEVKIKQKSQQNSPK